jgi:hypothetical protein
MALVPLKLLRFIRTKRMRCPTTVLLPDWVQSRIGIVPPKVHTMPSSE